MREEECIDKWRQGVGKWQTGKNHGKMERQTELSWRIETKTPKELKSLIKKINKASEKVWEEAGVGVL